MSYTLTITRTFDSPAHAAAWLITLENVDRGAAVAQEAKNPAPAPKAAASEKPAGKPPATPAPSPAASAPSEPTAQAAQRAAAAPAPSGPSYADLVARISKLSTLSQDAPKDVFTSMGLPNFKPLNAEGKEADRAEALKRVNAKIAELESAGV